MQVFNDSGHRVGRASIKETSLKASNGEGFKTLNSLLIISSFLFEIKSLTRKIPFSARFPKYTLRLLSPIQINLFFHKITFDLPPTQTFLGVRHAFLPHVGKTLYNLFAMAFEPILTLTGEISLQFDRSLFVFLVFLLY